MFDAFKCSKHFHPALSVYRVRFAHSFRTVSTFSGTQHKTHFGKLWVSEFGTDHHHYNADNGSGDDIVASYLLDLILL